MRENSWNLCKNFEKIIKYNKILDKLDIKLEEIKSIEEKEYGRGEEEEKFFKLRRNIINNY